MAEISFTLNGAPVTVTTDGERMLLGFCGAILGLPGPSFGCGEGYCGACTVFVNKTASTGANTRCETPTGKRWSRFSFARAEAERAPGSLRSNRTPSSAGFCTPGMICDAYSVLLRNARPSREQILTMRGEYVHCGACGRVVQAIESAERKDGRNGRMNEDEVTGRFPRPGALGLISRRDFLKGLGGGMIILVSLGVPPVLAAEAARREQAAHSNAYLGSARTAGSVASRAGSRWGGESSPRWPGCWPTN